MKTDRLLSLVALLLVCTFACAHEFWLEPVRFLLKRNEKVHIDLMVGENYQGEQSNGHKYKILKLDHYNAGQKVDIRNQVYGDSLSSLDLSFSTEGTHLIAFSNSSKFIELQAAKFNDYLKSEGLENIALLRKKRGDNEKSGREMYQRCVKTLVRVGEKVDQSYGINTGMHLEIIPNKSPYSNDSVLSITFKVLFDNKPVVNSLVLAWHTVGGRTTHKMLRSNSKGEVMFPITKTGKWMISTVHMIANTDIKQSAWQSFWGSYTFGYY